MLCAISVQNFRSIEECEVELAPITVLFGPTAAGKSSLLYAMLALRNFVLNPNQALDGIFNLGFQNLGSFEACVFNHDVAKEMMISVDYALARASGSYGVRFTKATAQFALKPNEVSSDGQKRFLGQYELKPVPIPYGLSPAVTYRYRDDVDYDSEEEEEATSVDAAGSGSEAVAAKDPGEHSYSVAWNGVNAVVNPEKPSAETQARAAALAAIYNRSVEALKRTDIAPHRRGFFKPSYSIVPISPLPTTEDEVASLLMNDMNLAPRVSACTEDIFGRDFRVSTSPGTSIAFFQTTDKRARMPVWLVNDGFGINQVVYILAKLQRLDVDTLFIEEPEVHLHPTVLQKFAGVLCSLVKEEGKQVVITTHSSQFLLSLLARVRERNLTPEQVSCYHVTRELKSTVFARQEVRENGQLEGGLSSLVEAEIEDLKSLSSPRT